MNLTGEMQSTDSRYFIRMYFPETTISLTTPSLIQDVSTQQTFSLFYTRSLNTHFTLWEHVSFTSFSELLGIRLNSESSWSQHKCKYKVESSIRYDFRYHDIYREGRFKVIPSQIHKISDSRDLRRLLRSVWIQSMIWCAPRRRSVAPSLRDASCRTRHSRRLCRVFVSVADSTLMRRRKGPSFSY